MTQSLDYETFVGGMQDLQAHYNRKLTDVALLAWYNYLERRMSDEKFLVAVVECICVCEFLPAPQKFAEIAGASTSVPGENWAMYKDAKLDYFALPSTEMVVESLTGEQRHINHVKICAELASKKDMNKKKNQFEKPAKEKFEDMRQFLLCDRPTLKQEAISWAKRQPNVFFIYSNDGDDLPVDIKWLEDDTEIPF